MLLVLGAVIGGSGWWWMHRSTPQKTIAAFFEAGQKGDIKAFGDTISANDRKMIPESFMSTVVKTAFPVQGITYKIQSTEISSNRASSKIQVTAQGQTTTQWLELVKEDGTWKVDLIASGKKTIQNMMGGMRAN